MVAEGSQWPARVEGARWHFDAVGFHVLEEIRPQAGGAKTALNITGVVGMLLHKAIDLLHLNGLAFHAGDLADANEPALAVRKALQLQHQRDRGRDLAADAADRRRHPGHGHHLLEPFEGIAWRISV